MRTKDYINAAYDILKKEQDTDAVLGSLKKYLESRGLMKLYPSVLRGLIERSERAQKHEGVHVIVARESDAQMHKNAIAAHLDSLSLPAAYDISIDETLIGGYILKTKNTRVDQSYKHKLLQAYRALTV